MTLGSVSFEIMRRISSLISGVITLFCCGLLGTPLLADDPLPPPEKVVAWSEDHTYLVESVPNGETTLYRMPNYKTVWNTPGWHRSVFVSNSGVVAIGYGGINLLPLKYKADLILIELWQDGRITHKMRLSDIIHNLKFLQRTSSHYYWGYIFGFNKSNLLDVETVEGRVSIDPKNGSIRKHQATRRATRSK